MKGKFTLGVFGSGKSGLTLGNHQNKEVPVVAATQSLEMYPPIRTRCPIRPTSHFPLPRIMSVPRQDERQGRDEFKIGNII